MSSYHVIAFRAGDPRAESSWLHEQGYALFVASKRRMLGKDPSPPFEYIDVLSIPDPPPEEFRGQLEALGLSYEVPERYLGYAKVYFVNDAALRMYRENGIDLTVLETVPESELPRQPGSSLCGPYVFLDPANRSDDGASHPPARHEAPPFDPEALAPRFVFPVRAVGLPEHGLHLRVAEDGTTAVLENQTDEPVVAYTLVRITRWSDEREDRAPDGYVNVSALRYPGQYLADGCVPAGATEPLGAKAIGAGVVARGIRRGVAGTEPPTVIESTVLLDGAFFSDGSFVGPDETGFFDGVKARFEATHELASDLLAARDRGLSPAEAVDGLLTIAGEEYRLDHVAHPGPGGSTYEYHRKRQALEFLNVRDAAGPDAVLSHAAELVATAPHLRRR